MTWLQLILTTSSDKAPACAESLSDAGAVAVTLQDAKDDPLYEPPLNTTPLWHQTQVIGLFPAEVNLHSVQGFLKRSLDSQTYISLKSEPLEDKNWTEAWMDRFQPMQYGSTLWVCPSHTEIPDPTAINVLLDPGLAFGTGTHPTTRLCLEWLDEHPPRQARVIDYGCGSGILGIAALKLGASFVYAIDYDPQALISTQQNSQHNGFSTAEIIPLLPNELNLTARVDVILANILLNPLIELAPTFSDCITEEGIVVISGILEAQIQPLLAEYSRWFKVVDTAIQEGWARISFSRLNP